MSKSKGNFVTLRGACPTADDVRAYRYLVISSHYRNPLSFTEQAMSAAKGALKRIDRLRVQIDHALATNAGGEAVDSEITREVAKYLENFDQALADDLSMPRAAASLFGVVKAAESEFKRIMKASTDENAIDSLKPLDVAGIRAVRGALDLMDQVFGIFYEVPVTSDIDTNKIDDDTSVPEEVMQLVDQRAAAKEAKDWELADSLRNRITKLGFVVKDVKGNVPIVSRIS